MAKCAVWITLVKEKLRNYYIIKTMKEIGSKNGSAQSLVLGIIAVIVIVGAVIYFTSLTEPGAPMTQEDNVDAIEITPSPADANQNSMGYQGEVLAGTQTVLLDFTSRDYEAALATDKLIVLYFYANWCPICREEFPKMQSAFNELQTGEVIGFRVNYNDDQTDADERNLARQFGVAYQHTKVFLKNGERILKSPEEWDKNRYRNEIQNALSR